MDMHDLVWLVKQCDKGTGGSGSGVFSCVKPCNGFVKECFRGARPAAGSFASMEYPLSMLKRLALAVMRILLALRKIHLRAIGSFITRFFADQQKLRRLLLRFERLIE